MGQQLTLSTSTRARRTVWGLGLVMVLLTAWATPAGAGRPDLRVERVAGPDRFGTAVETAFQAHYDRCADTWMIRYDSEEECRDRGDLGNWTLVRGDSFADALSAASVYLGPILITPQAQIPPALERLDRRLSGQATIIGEEDVISPSVEQTLVPRFAQVTARYAGPTRYDTAVAVAQLHRDGYGSSSFPFVEVVIVNGENWPDALAAASLTDIMRVVLPTQRDALPDVVAEYLSESTGFDTTITVVGGTDAISDGVVAQIDAVTTGEVRRIAGATRFETARAVADVYFAERGVRSDLSDPESPMEFGVLLTRPDTFADAIAAPNLMRTRGAPILLAEANDDLGEGNADWLAAHAEQISSITGLGTPEVLTDTVLAQAQDAVCGDIPGC